MRYIATVHAYDVMSNVQVSVSVKEYPSDPQEPTSTVFVCTTTVPGTGENDPHQWLRDVLVAALEAT